MKPDENRIVELTIEFSLLVISYCEILDQKRKYVVSRQLLKSGTSIGANVQEAQSPESRLDFIHKLKIALKEAHETQYWLTLCMRSGSYPECDHLLERIKPIQRILNAIISTTRSRTKKAAF
jgi:four helix bundle protein